MSFTEQDIATLKQAKAQGKTKEQALAALALSRSQAATTTTEPTDTARQDLSAGFSGAKNAFMRGADRELNIESQGRGKVSELFGKFTSGVRAGGEALASLGEGAIRALPGGTTAMNAIEGVVGKGAQAVAGSPIAQAVGGTAKAGFGMLPESAQRTIGDVGNLALGGAQIGGTLVIPGASTKLVSSVSQNVAKKLDAIPTTAFKIDTTRAGDLITKYRTQLSNIDPKYETVLKQQPDATKTMAYFDQAEKAAMDTSAPMATKIAADRAVEAYKRMDATLSEVGKTKSELLDSIATYKVGGNIPGTAIDNVKSTIGERFGIQIDNKGNISQVTGRVASVDDKSQKLIADYVNGLRSLGPAPTARQLDDFVDAMQRKLYKQSSPNLFDVADEPVIAFLKQQTGDINSKLKTNVDQLLKSVGKDPDYSALNTKYSQLIDINENLNKRLGVEGDKGASLMKSIFSPQTGEPTRRLFQQIKDETGIDLFEEATLARFAMESVGDTRSKSLLQTIDAISGDVSKLNLMEPGSWLNFIREKADLDGRELANAIIKQAKDEKTSFKTGATPLTNFERAKDLTLEYRKIETKAFERISKDEEKLVNQYLSDSKLSGTDGKVVNTDSFRPLFKDDGYVGYNAAAVQEPASYLNKKVYTKLLNENPEPFVTFLAGGSGTGKTSAVKGIPEVTELMKNSAAILDSNLSNYNSAAKRILEAKKAGKNVVVDYIYRDPMDSLINGVVKRMISNPDEGGRLVPTKVVADNHIESWNVVNRLYKDGADVKFIDNSLGAGNARIVSFEEINRKISYPSKEELTNRFNKEIKKLYEQGIITEDQLEGYIQ